MKKIAGLAVSLAVVAALSGCKPKPEDQLVGKWNYQSLQAAGEPAAAMEQAKQKLAGSFATFGKDKSFALNAGGTTQVEGKWTIADHNITIVETAVGGKPVDQIKAQLQKFMAQNPRLAHMFDDLRGTLSDDAKTVTLNASATDKGTVTFTKAAS